MPKLYDKPGTPTYATKQMLAAVLHLYGRPFDFGTLQYRASAALRDLSKQSPDPCSLAQELMSLFPKHLRIALYFRSEGAVSHSMALMREDSSQPFRVSHRNISRVKRFSRVGVEARWPEGYTAAECGSVPPKLVPVVLSPCKIDIHDPEVALQVLRACQTISLVGPHQKNFSLWFNPGKTIVEVDLEAFPPEPRAVRHRPSEKVPSIRNTPRAYAFVPGDTFPVEVSGNGVLPFLPVHLGKAPKDLPLLVEDALTLFIHPYVAIDFGKPETFVYAPTFDGEHASVVKATSYKRTPHRIPTYTREGTAWTMNPAAALDVFNLLVFYPSRAKPLRDYLEYLGVEWTLDALLDLAKKCHVEILGDDLEALKKLFDGLPNLVKKPVA